MMPEALVRARALPSIVWLIPLVAAFVGLYLAYWAWTQTGPTITIRFESAEGLEAGRTMLKYKEVKVGQVEAVRLDEDLSHVVVTASVVSDLEDYLTEQTRFWVVRAQVSAGGVTRSRYGLLGGVHRRRSVERRRRRAPVRRPREAARRHLGQAGALLPPARRGARQRRASARRSTFRWLQVGRVAGYELSPSGDSVDVQVFVETPHDARVRSTTRFWNASGLDATIRADGLEIDTPSLASLLIGGVAFETPATVERRGRRARPTWSSSSTRTSRRRSDRRAKGEDRAILVFFEESVAGLVARVAGRVPRHRDRRGQGRRSRPRSEVGRDPDPGRDRDRDRAPRPREGRGRARLPLDAQVERGLRARLATKNLLTGQRSVDFDFLERRAEGADPEGRSPIPCCRRRPAASMRSRSASRGSSRRSIASRSNRSAANLDESLARLVRGPRRSPPARGHGESRRASRHHVVARQARDDARFGGRPDRPGLGPDPGARAADRRSRRSGAARSGSCPSGSSPIPKSSCVGGATSHGHRSNGAIRGSGTRFAIARSSRSSVVAALASPGASAAVRRSAISCSGPDRSSPRRPVHRTSPSSIGPVRLPAYLDAPGVRASRHRRRGRARLAAPLARLLRGELPARDEPRRREAPRLDPGRDPSLDGPVPDRVHASASTSTT